VTLSQDNGSITCSSTKNFTVQLSDTPIITTVVTSDWTDNDNAITVLVSGNGNYEFSIDGINYQSSNQFYGLPSGKYTVFVQDECGIASKDVILLMYPRFFTPNGDGINDLWRIPYSHWEPGMTVKILDRFGKLLKELHHDDAGWDGMYNGFVLPSTDYWFVVKRADGIEYQGHFTLKR
jgi:gliding motility-associated-like protein